MTLISNSLITIDAHIEPKANARQKEYQDKRKFLTEPYKILEEIIKSYPDTSPNRILLDLEDDPPHYLMEAYDAVLQSLDWQIEDYQRLLNVTRDYKAREQMAIHIKRRQYAKQQIADIRDEYYAAKDLHKSFDQSYRSAFDLYAGQSVKNCLVQFEVAMHNIFFAGLWNDHQINDDTIRTVKRNLENAMRQDIGIF